MLQSLLKSVLHNVFVVAVGFAFALLGTGVDKVFGFPRFHSAATLVVGVTLLAAGFLLRVWAAYHFYKYRMNVIVLSAQSHLITSGPYRFSRNPLMAYPSASGDAKCCSREGAFVLERITNITALGGHDDRLSALLARVPAALWRRGGLRSIPGRGALA